MDLTLSPLFPVPAIVAAAFAALLVSGLDLVVSAAGLVVAIPCHSRVDSGSH